MRKPFDRNGDGRLDVSERAFRGMAFHEVKRAQRGRGGEKRVSCGCLLAIVLADALLVLSIFLLGLRA